MKTMKALSKLKPEVGLWKTEVPIPTINGTEVLIRIKKTAICGTDLHIYNWDQWAQKTIPVPMPVGHEFVGEIVELGKYVKGLSVGDRVSGEGHIVCGHCRNCRAGKMHLCRNTIGVGVNRPGCFAEYLAIPASNVYKVPDCIPDHVVAAFDPLGNAVHTALSFPLIGEDIMITGAGPIGLFCILIAKFCGAKNILITDVNDHRLKMAEQMGAQTLNVKAYQDLEQNLKAVKAKMNELAMTEGFDVGLELTGHSMAIQTMIESMNHGGKMSLLGFSGQNALINWDTIVWRGLQLKGIYGREMFETWYKMTSMLQSGLDVSPVITHEFPVDDFQKGFDIMLKGQCGKVILNWE